MKFRRVYPLGSLLATAWLVVSCSTVPDRVSDDSVVTVSEGLDAPWSVAFLGDTALVSERDSARILELDGGGAEREIGRIESARPSGEGGVLGLAVNGATLFVYVTTDGENRVEKYPLEGAPGGLDLGEPELVFAGIPASATHNGGRIGFGPDGKLYVTTGDAGQSYDAQDLSSYAGKILRLNPDGGVPGDNPFEGSPVYSYGHRNPQGIGWDEGGVLYASEFGQNTWDELNVIEAGANYGWPVVEGIAGDERFIDPVQQWAPRVASPSGLAVTNDSILIANLRGQCLRQIPLADSSTSIEHWSGEYGRLRDVVVAPDGRIWVLTNNSDGRGTPAAGDDRILVFPGR